MAAVNYVVLFDSVSGVVHGLWIRETSDNISTFIADGYLDVDGVHVCSGMDTAGGLFTPAAAVVVNPTVDDVEAPAGALKVDSVSLPADVQERGAEDSDRSQLYNYSS